MDRTVVISLLFAAVLYSQPASHAQSITLTPETIEGFASKYGNDARARLTGWDELMRTRSGDPESAKRVLANDFFNRIEWISDQDHWGLRDYWATPLEMIGTNGGDCEDFSIGKYFTLTALDVPRDKLLITYVRAPRLKQPHMVLAYYATPDADPLILDNLEFEIRPGSQRPDLIPIYSFNADGLWKAVQRGRGEKVGSAKRLDLWRDLLARMERELGAGVK